MKAALFSFFLIIVSPVFAQLTIKGTVYYESNEYELNMDALGTLDKVLKNLKNVKIEEIKLTGYTDSDGDTDFNKKLSEKRVLAVADYLVSKGAERNALRLHYLGEKLQTPPGAEKWENRRVDICIEGDNLFAPSEFTIAFRDFKINPDSDTTVKIDAKGTLLHIPKYAFVDDNGRIIKEDVTIKYREFANSADIAFSGIPMTYKQNNEEFCFNSSGMFEIDGFVNDQPVQINKNKSLKIDYALAKKNPDICFFKLNETSKNWEKLNDIEPIDKPVKGDVAEGGFLIIRWDGGGAWVRDGDNAGNFVLKDDGNRTNATLLAEGMDKGHTYPDIVKGLNVSGFGVYNCDQIYRLPNRVQINAQFVDMEGEKIAQPHVLSVIDLNYNGAFSFDPHSFTCDAKGQNVLALFTTDGEFYIMDKQDFAQMKIEKSGEYTFKMKKMSDKIKDSKDLANYLGIKI